MLYLIQQVLLRSAMGVVAGNTRSGAGLDPVMGVDKACFFLIVTFGAELSDRFIGQR